MILHTQNGLAVSSTNFRGDNLTLPSVCFSLPHILAACIPPGVLSQEQAEETVDGHWKRRGEGLPESPGRPVWILPRRSEIQTRKNQVFSKVYKFQIKAAD